MRHQNGEGPAHRIGGGEAREFEQLGRRLEVLSTAEKILGQVRIVVTPCGQKWRAMLDSKTLCVAAAPLVASARVLVAQGVDPNCIIEMWHLGADGWALRGQLGAVAAVRLDGEKKASHRARNGSPARSSRPGVPLPAGDAL